MIIVLGIHVVIVIAVFILSKLNIVRCSGVSLFSALFLPIIGELMLFVEIIMPRKLKNSEHGVEKVHSSVLDLEKMPEQEREDDRSLLEALMNDSSEKRKKIIESRMTDSPLGRPVHEDDEIVPLSETLAVNSSEVRRTKIMDVLYERPDDYTKQLLDAKTNDDSEVVHYAVTALVEMQKKYDQRYQKLMKMRAEAPDDRRLLRTYQAHLEEYLSSGLLQGNNEKTQLLNYKEVLQERIEKEGATLTLCMKQAQADLELKDVDALSDDADELIDTWPEQETGYLYKIQAYALKSDASGIADVISAIDQNQIHLSDEGRSVVSFWRR